MNGPVICGIDDSGVSVDAAEAARELADRYELPLLFAHVCDEATCTGQAEALLQDATAFGHADMTIEAGHPADRLVAIAEEREASFLVVGNHGPRSSLLGSISADVSRRAPCPVLVVPQQQRAAASAGGEVALSSAMRVGAD